MFNLNNKNQAENNSATDTADKELPESIFEQSRQKEAERQTKTVISKDCIIRGEVSGGNDIEVLGTIEGSVSLNNNTFSVEESAQVNANISAKHVNINGQVVGNIEAIEKIVINDTGKVTGDMLAPKVVLKDGSYFKGGISMVENKVRSAPATKQATETSAKPAPAEKPKTATTTAAAK